MTRLKITYMISKTLIKILLKIDGLIERFQDSLQHTRLKILEAIWDIKGKETKRQVRSRVQKSKTIFARQIAF